jgi:hypothetical protein
MADLPESIDSSVEEISIVPGTGDDTTSDMCTISILATKRSTESLQTRDHNRSDRSHIAEAGQPVGGSQPGNQIQQKEEDEEREAQKIEDFYVLRKLQESLNSGKDPKPWKIYKEWLQRLPSFYDHAVRVFPYVQNKRRQKEHESVIRPGEPTPEALLRSSYKLWYEARETGTWLNVGAESEEGTFLETIQMQTR